MTSSSNVENSAHDAMFTATQSTTAIMNRNKMTDADRWLNDTVNGTSQTQQSNSIAVPNPHIPNNVFGWQHQLSAVSNRMNLNQNHQHHQQQQQFIAVVGTPRTDLYAYARY